MVTRVWPLDWEEPDVVALMEVAQRLIDGEAVSAVERVGCLEGIESLRRALRAAWQSDLRSYAARRHATPSLN